VLHAAQCTFHANGSGYLAQNCDKQVGLFHQWPKMEKSAIK
jgi:hypothetical protein